MKLRDIKAKGIGYIKLENLNDKQTELYNFLLKEYETAKVDKHSLSLTPKQKVTLIEIKHKNHKPFNDAGYGLFVGALFVNTNWLVFGMPYTEIMKLETYFERVPGYGTAHAINY